MCWAIAESPVGARGLGALAARKIWCGRGDLNPYVSRHWILNPARLPISATPARYCWLIIEAQMNTSREWTVYLVTRSAVRLPEGAD